MSGESTEQPPRPASGLAPIGPMSVRPLTTRGSIPSTHIDGTGEAARAVLRFIDGALAGREFELPLEASIGRKNDATVLLPPEERVVSASHCTIRRTPGGFWVLQDAGSSAGTFLNRERVRPGTSPVLRSGDVVGLGERGPTAVFTLRSSSYAGELPQDTYAITLARAGDQPDRRRFADRPLVLIGRDRDCEIRFDAHGEREVSKRHARIRYAGRCFMIDDLDSKAGTLVNGVRVASTMLHPGDIVELGPEGPKLVVEALEGVDDRSEHVEAALELAETVARRRSRIALLGVAAAIVVAGVASLGVWWVSEKRAEALEADLQRRDDETAATAPGLSTTERFQAVATRHGDAVLLVYAHFHIEVDGIHGPEDPFDEGSSYGSGFVISVGEARALAITNRHVVQPWVGDVEYADMLRRAQEAFGAEKVKVVSTLALWPAGTQARTSSGEIAFERGFNTHVLSNLRVVGFPPEHLVDAPFAGQTVKVVANDHTDLALLELTGLVVDESAVFRLAPTDVVPRPMDPVMSLGFPAGPQLLEGSMASLSPTLGEIRKIEKTIQLSMATYPGNSGGPVLDADGRVLGVTTRRFGEGVGVCIPIDKVRALIQHLGVAP